MYEVEVKCSVGTSMLCVFTTPVGCVIDIEPNHDDSWKCGGAWGCTVGVSEHVCT